MKQEALQDELTRAVAEYSDMLLRLAMTRLSQTSDAEDCVQEVFIKLFHHGCRFQSREHEKSWLIRVTLNQAYDMLRSAARQNVSLDDLGELPAPEKQDSLLSAIRCLPAPYAAVLHLYYYEDCTVREIGRLLHLPRATVSYRLARARDQLKLLLEE